MSSRSYGIMRIRNHTLFEDTEIELKPLTLFIGRNAAGKSNLLNLIWLFLSSGHYSISRSVIKVITKKESENYVDGVLEKAQRGEDVEPEFKSLIRSVLKELSQQLEDTFNIRFRSTFRSEPGEFSRPPGLCIELSSGFDARSTRYVTGLCYDESLNRFRVKIENLEAILSLVDDVEIRATHVPGRYVARYRGEEWELSIRRQFPLIWSMRSTIRRILKELIHPWIFFWEPSAFLVDGRSGLIRSIEGFKRLIERYLIDEDYLRELSLPDREFIRTYLSQIRSLYIHAEFVDIRPTLDIIRNVLRELGVEHVIPRRERGYITLYVKLWNGVETSLDKAPSGIRELLTPLLALAMDSYPVVMIEEPEAHLHPAAILALGNAIARAVNKRKKLVLISTHSDVLLTRLDHLVKASKLDTFRRKVIGLDDTLSPDQVAVYLFKRDENAKRTVIKRIEVTDEGISEDEFSEVSKELVNEGSLIELARGSGS